MLALDLGVFNRKIHAPSFREAALWSAVWIGLALVLNGVVFHWMGPLKGTEWFHGYVPDKPPPSTHSFVFSGDSLARSLCATC